VLSSASSSSAPALAAVQRHADTAVAAAACLKQTDDHFARQNRAAAKRKKGKAKEQKLAEALKAEKKERRELEEALRREQKKQRERTVPVYSVASAGSSDSVASSSRDPSQAQSARRKRPAAPFEAEALPKTKVARTEKSASLPALPVFPGKENQAQPKLSPSEQLADCATHALLAEFNAQQAVQDLQAQLAQAKVAKLESELAHVQQLRRAASPLDPLR
jgi:hypothetical protein